MEKKDAMSNDRHRGKNNRNDEIRKRVISKNWTEVNVCPCEKWASGWHNDKGAGDVQDNAEAGNERVTGVKVVTNLLRFFRRSPGK